MPANKSSSANKQKATARQNATKKVAERDRAPQAPSVRTSQKETSQSRFPGETALTGEDRPTNRRGGKRYGGGPGFERGPVAKDDSPSFKAPARKRRPARGPR